MSRDEVADEEERHEEHEGARIAERRERDHGHTRRHTIEREVRFFAVPCAQSTTAPSRTALGSTARA